MTRTLCAFGLFLACFTDAANADAPHRPNVVLIMADDMGYGDLGCHGNPKIKTPNLDKLAGQSVQFQSFYVSPVCTPTRASLMTGRYNYRTGAIDTFIGRAMMHPDETTLAEMLSSAGYRTGIFGKWHLGDNYPLRAIDQGFQEALVLKGGGIGQPSDPPGGSSYFDPVLFHNGKQVKTKGYCSDVYTDAAMKFIAAGDKPFFVYLPFNCPHDPLQVADELVKPYKEMNLAASEFPKTGNPLPAQLNQDQMAKVYAMVTNIDANVGRLLAKLDELKLADNTIVIFLTDNGPQHPRYNAGMLARKGSVHDGGIRVPLFVRWPGQFKPHKVEPIAAHIDITPTILAACGFADPKNVKLDGRNLLPLLKQEKVAWPDRTLFFQWHRGDVPELYRAFAARSQKYKLVQPLGVQVAQPGSKLPEPPAFKLYDMEKDPFEMKDLAAERPEIVAKLKKEYEAWFKDVSATRGYAPPRIHLGAPQDNPTTLTRQDWRGPRAGWTPTSLGHWEVQVAKEGTYEIKLRVSAPAQKDTPAYFKLGEVSVAKMLPAGGSECVFSDVKLKVGPGKLEAWLGEGKDAVGVHQVDVMRKE